MKRFIVFAFIMIAGYATVLAQETPLDGVYEKKNVEEARLMQYAGLREADILYNRGIWRIIDMREKLNLPMKYPKGALIDVIMDAVLAGELTAYNPDVDDEFSAPMTPEDVAEKGRSEEITTVQDPVTGEIVTENVVTEFNRADVIKYRLKEEWFFDKQRSVFECRIIGMAPIYNLRSSDGTLIGEAALFWIYFPEARNIFMNAEVFNRFNDAKRMSYDDVFIKRMFSSYITKESNVYDRRIKDYKTGTDALYEAESIKLKLFKYEHDVWEY